MKKITKFQKICLIAVSIFVVAILGYFSFKSFAQARTSSHLPTPQVKQQTFPGGIMIAWNISQKDVYSFIIDRQTKRKRLNDRKTIAIFNPDPVGYAHITDGGFYTDEKVTSGTNYTYYVTTFDRQGNESSPATVTITAK